MQSSSSVLAFLGRKQLKPAFDYRDVWQEEHHPHFTVAKAMRLDILEAIYQAVIDASAEGQTLRQLQQSLTPVLQKKGWWDVKPLRDPLTGDMVEAQLGSRFVIAALDKDLKRRLGAKQKAVLLSDETLAKQKQHHPELALDEYRLIPEAVQKGKVIREKDARLYFFQRQGHLYMATIKATEDKAENYLVTFFRVRPVHMQRKQRRGELIRDWQRD